METTEAILPDLQSCVLCEDVRCEFNGMNTLVGVLNVIAAPSLPINYLRLCIWTRWCSGTGKFKQRSRIVGVDEQNVLVHSDDARPLLEFTSAAAPARPNAQPQIIDRQRRRGDDVEHADQSIHAVELATDVLA